MQIYKTMIWLLKSQAHPNPDQLRTTPTSSANSRLTTSSKSTGTKRAAGPSPPSSRTDRSRSTLRTRLCTTPSSASKASRRTRRTTTRRWACSVPARTCSGCATRLPVWRFLTSTPPSCRSACCSYSIPPHPR